MEEKPPYSRIEDPSNDYSNAQMESASYYYECNEEVIMYFNEKLRGEITESGQRYSPYLHRQRLPFRALNSVVLGPNKSWCFLVKCLLRSIRDVHDMPCSKKVNSYGYSAYDIRQAYAEIWEPALNVFSDMLADLGLAKNEKFSAHRNVYLQIKALGFDLLKDSYHAYSLSLSLVATALAKVLFTTNTDRLDKYLDALKQKNSILADHLLILQKSIRQSNRQRHDLFSQCAQQSANLIALNYFVSFHSHYQLHEKTVYNAVEAILNKDYQNSSVLRAIYNDTYTSAPKHEPWIDTAAVTALFNK